MKDRAYAKINLSLDVFNIREDGYHDLLSIMLSIDFYDELEISIDTQDSFSCNRHFIRYNEKNSIYKMISLIKERYGIKDGANSYQLSFSPVSSITGAEGFRLNYAVSPDTVRSRTNP